MAAPDLLVYIGCHMEPSEDPKPLHGSTPLLLRHRHVAIRITLVFMIASTLWVVFSDTLIGDLSRHSITDIQILKGLSYTAAMTVLLFIMLRRWEARLRAAAAKESRMSEAMADAIAAMLNLRDPLTARHTNRTVELCARLGKALGLARAEIADLVLAAKLHDIGNIGIPSDIFNKPGPLSRPERGLIQTHARNAHELLKDAGVPAPVPEIVLQHHERLDGRGYPDHIMAEDIVPGARILAVADVVAAMASHRPYRPAHDREAIADELKARRGTSYDAAVVDACLPMLSDTSIPLADA